MRTTDQIRRSLELAMAQLPNYEASNVEVWIDALRQAANELCNLLDAQSAEIAELRKRLDDCPYEPGAERITRVGDLSELASATVTCEVHGQQRLGADELARQIKRKGRWQCPTCRAPIASLDAVLPDIVFDAAPDCGNTGGLCLCGHVATAHRDNGTGECTADLFEDDTCGCEIFEAAVFAKEAA